MVHAIHFFQIIFNMKEFNTLFFEDFLIFQKFFGCFECILAKLRSSVILINFMNFAV